MAQQTINIGASPNDGTGTPLRTAFQYTNSNFSELYTAVGPSGNNIVVPGNATITGDLTVDTSTLKVDSANNRVGVVNASPSFALDVNGAGSGVSARISSGSGTGFRFDTTRNISGLNRNYLIGCDVLNEGWFSIVPSTALGGGTFTNPIYNASYDGIHAWSDGAGSERMRLNSTGLGVGVVPGSAIGNLQVGGSSNVNLYVQQGTDTIRMGVRASGRTGIILDSSNATYTNRAWYLDNVGSSGSLIIGRQGLDVITFDNSGNVGIGVTPTNVAGYRKLELGGSSISALLLNTNSSNAAARNWATASNFNAFGDYVFLQSNALGGDPVSAGTARMTLDASGNLLVGNTTSPLASRLSLFTTFAQPDGIVIRNTNATAGLYWRFGAVNNSNTLFVMNASSVGVTMADGASAWSAVSDERLKDIIEPISNAVAKIGSLRSVIGKYKSDSEGTRRSFLIAQDVKSVLPEAVDSTDIESLGLRYTEVIPLLVAAIKELTAEVNALKNA